jgi:CelD/BcsL family acetyltransferase involved in cellulose biosynthesis
MQSVGTAHHRHEWRRQERRLGDKGAVSYAVLDRVEDAAAWVKAFVELEMKGWKGREGTAFGSAPSHRQWLEEIAGAAAEEGRLMMLSLNIDGKPVAMKLNILAPPGAYAFKIAYDEALSKFSPGVLLELENIRQLHADPRIEWMDSLAAPEHSLMERVWTDQAAIVDVAVAPGGLQGRLLLSALPLLRTLKRLLVRTH